MSNRIQKFAWTFSYFPKNSFRYLDLSGISHGRYPRKYQHCLTVSWWDYSGLPIDLTWLTRPNKGGGEVKNSSWTRWVPGTCQNPRDSTTSSIDDSPFFFGLPDQSASQCTQGSMEGRNVCEFPLSWRDGGGRWQRRGARACSKASVLC